MNTVILLIALICVVKLSIFLIFSLIDFLRSAKRKFSYRHIPFVSIIVPCHNEGKTLVNCLETLNNLRYPEFEIVVVDDGSNDNTCRVAKEYAETHPRIVVYAKPDRGGKAAALNYGIRQSKGEIVITIDADSILHPDAIWHLIKWFEDPKVGAVSGNVKVANKNKFLTIHQATEYLMGLNIQRRAFGVMGAIQVIPGAIGAFRRVSVEAANYYSSDTRVEDMDITIAIQEAGYKIVFEPKAIAYTEVPENITDFLNQRHRWIYGSFRIIQKYRHLLFNPKGGRIGNIGLGYCLIFPFVDLFLCGWLYAMLFYYAYTSNFYEASLLIAIIVSTNLALAVYALLLDHDNYFIILGAALAAFWYYPLISLVTIQSVFSFITNRQEVHVRFARLGKNQPQVICNTT